MRVKNKSLSEYSSDSQLVDSHSPLIPPGYKQTEVGVIPEDWEVKELGEVCRFAQGIQVDLDKQLYSHSDGYTRFLRIENYTQGSNDYRFIPTYLCMNKIVNEQDIVIVRYGANAGFIGRGLNGALANNLFKVDPTLSILFKDFLYIYLKCDKTFNYFQTSMSGGAMPALSFKIAKSLQLPIPTKAEQEAIAGALSDADALIESLEQLITKKRRLKQGAMQELLTGKKRLPGFEIKPGYKQTEVGMIPVDWDSPELGSIIKSMQLGGNYKNSEGETKWPLIKMGNLGRGSINLDKIEYIDSAQTPISRDRLKGDDILFNTRNTLDLVGKISIWRNELPEAYFNSNIARMKFEEDSVASYPFMNYIMNTSRFLKGLRSIAIGTTSVAAIYGRDLVKLRVPLPTKTEQEVIATILSDMDAEIESLETKLAKTRQLKQGMMQELLTGRIRLI